MDRADLTNRFVYHSPDDDRKNRHENVRAACFSAAHGVNLNCPDGREKSLAITKLEEAMMWANAAIARNHEAFNETEENK